MARVKKIDNVILKRLRRIEEREQRIMAIKEERKYFLLFCEGSRTEPNYFKSLAEQLPKNLVQIEIDPIGGLNTISLVKHAITVLPKYSRRYPTIDFEVWIVFDKDSFLKSDFDNAINLASAKGLNCAYSNEAFELWYLLHFEFYQTAISRHQYGKLLSKYLKRKYEKNSTEIYHLLQTLDNSNEALAIKWAKDLEAIHEGKPPSNSNPITKVYMLVEELNRFKELSI